jgi:negative regulator of sigma-B (phosphoserine phosphatase)
MFDIAYRTSPRVGEYDSGDAVVVRREEGVALLAVIDGLGHGRLAALAANAAVKFLGGWTIGDDLEGAMRGIHDALRGTRGAAGAVCVLRERSFLCCGVGNVEIRCLGVKLPILLSPGVLGARVQSFRVCRGEVPVGTRLVLFSDGISYRVPLDSLRNLEPEILCETLMRDFRKVDDDASVLVCDVKA